MLWSHDNVGCFVKRFTALVALAAFAASAGAGPREQAKRMHDRIAGVPPSAAVLDAMEDEITAGRAEAAALIAMDNPSFYSVTLKNLVTPWTNREQTVFVPLNDYTATVIGMVRDDLPFNQVLSADVLYVGNAGLGLPAVSPANNDHYEQMETRGVNLLTGLQRTTQSGVYGTPPAATAGVLTSRAAAQSFFIAGTNRAMFRFTLMNYMCRDLEQVQDTSRPPDRIRQDVSRSPGGDARLFLNNCVGCHSGMDPMAQAFAYYTYDEAQGRMVYTGGNVQPKYFNNDTTFAFGFRTPDDDVGEPLAGRAQRAARLGPVVAGIGQRRQDARRGVRRERGVRHLPGREGVPHRVPAQPAGRGGPRPDRIDDELVPLERLPAEAGVRRRRHVLHGQLRDRR